MKKDNCIKIDIDRIKEMIELENISNPLSYHDRYVIMNEKTLIYLQLQSEYTMHFSSTTYPSIFGCPIAICNKLSLGEVEIR